MSSMKLWVILIVFFTIISHSLFAQFLPDERYQIINKKSGKAMCVYNDSTKRGYRIYQWEKGERESSVWQLQYTKTGKYFIRNLHTGLYLTVYRHSRNENAVCVQGKDRRYPSYLWRIQPYHESGYFKLRNGNSHKPIGPYHDRTENGVYVVQEDDRGHDGLLWEIVKMK